MVSHVYDPERVRQTHGISRMAPVLRRIRDLAEYDAAQLRVARAEASIGLLIKGGDDDDEPLELDGMNVAYLGEEEEVTPFTPSRPGNTYDPFVKAQLKAIAAGVGISYPQIARDFEGGSFSSQRQNSIEDRREFQPLQQLLVTQLGQPVLDDFVFVWSMQNPAASGDFFLCSEPERPSWKGQGWEWVDPEAQGKGIERQMRLGLTSRTEQANLLGRTVEELDEERRRDGTIEVLQGFAADGRSNPAGDSVSPVADAAAEVTDAV
jgi:lambda family phage portal protein